jgi:enamine deaminase RidA (YjgF/YER057c/UK114 family)
VGEASFGEEDDALDASPSGLGEDESDDDGAFEMRPTERPDADATRDSSSDDERDSEREQTGARRFRGGARGVSRFIPARGAADADADADSEDLNREATRLAEGLGAERGAGADADGAGDPKRARTEDPLNTTVHERCPWCAHVFVGPQGVPGHYKKHMNKGSTREEMEAGRAALAEHKAYIEAKNGPKPARVAPRGRRTARQLDLEPEVSDGGAEDADVPKEPFPLEPSARNCTECKLRCRTQRELIEHMLDAHGIEAQEREEVDGPLGDLAGMQPFAGEEQDIAPYALPGYDAHALVSPLPARGGQQEGDAAADRVADVEVVREMMIRQQTADRQLDEFRAENRAMRLMIDELRQEVLLLKQQPIVRKNTSADHDLGYAAITTFGRMVYLTGVVGATPRDVHRQTLEALTYLKQSLNKAGTDLRHLLKVTVFLSDIRLAEKAYAAWDEFFDVERVDRSQRPTRITQAASLKSPETYVEMHADAVLPAPLLAEGVMGMLPGPAGATPA